MRTHAAQVDHASGIDYTARLEFAAWCGGLRASLLPIRASRPFRPELQKPPADQT